MDLDLYSISIITSLEFDHVLIIKKKKNKTIWYHRMLLNAIKSLGHRLILFDVPRNKMFFAPIPNSNVYS